MLNHSVGNTFIIQSSAQLGFEVFAAVGIQAPKPVMQVPANQLLKVCPKPQLKELDPQTLSKAQVAKLEPQTDSKVLEDPETSQTPFLYPPVAGQYELTSQGL